MNTFQCILHIQPKIKKKTTSLNIQKERRKNNYNKKKNKNNIYFFQIELH